MFVHNLNPVLLSLGPLQIRYYGLLYVIGFILAYFILKKLVSEQKLKFTVAQIEDLLVYAGIAGIIGARLFYVIVYDAAFYAANLFEVFAVWHGGLSFHGAVIGALYGVYLFSRRNKTAFLQVLDIIAIPFALAVGIGRIGNFINGELYGRITDVAWCVQFPGAAGCRHPWPLYEMLYMFAIFIVLWSLRNKKMKQGMIAVLFMLLYSIARFSSEFVREPDAQLGFIVFGLTMGQLLNVVLFILAIMLYFRINRDIKKQ